MKKISNIIFSGFFSAFFTVYSLINIGGNAFAAQSENTGGVSKGAAAFIMITVFIATAVITAFITFRIKKKKFNASASVPSDDRKEE